MSTPFADFSLIFSEPELVDRFIVQRRADRIDTHGRSQPRVVEQHETHGVVVAASPNDMARLPDQENQDKTLSIATTFRLQGPAPGRQPDFIVWHGETYVVKAVDDYSRFGPGFTSVLAQRIDAAFLPPQEGL